MRHFGFSILAVLVTIFSSTTLLANNGANLIGASAASIAMGGTGVANFTNGTDAMFKNPALLTNLKGPDGNFGLELHTTILKLNAKGSYSDTLPLSANQTRADVNNETTTRVIPNIVGTYKLNPNWAVGLGILGLAGSTSNYPNENQIAKVMSDVTFARIAPTVAYKPAPWISLGISPYLGYGDFALNESASTNSSLAEQSTRKPHSSLGVGVMTGLNITSGMLNFGFSWLSKVSYSFKDLTDVEAFAGSANGLDTIEVEQPEEFGMGVSVKPVESLTLAFDYRLIRWSAAAGYKSFSWQDQNVWAIGAEYRLNQLALRAGFNLADAPYGDVSGESGATTHDLQGHLISNKSVSNLNLFAFPAVATTHVTVGSGYKFSDSFELDSSFMYAFSREVTRSGTFSGPTSYTYSTKASLWTLTLGGRYSF